MHTAPADAARPLVVDLDGTLIRSDLLIETFFTQVGKDPGCLPRLAAVLFRGRAFFKQAVAEDCALDAGTLPYNPAVLELIRARKAAGGTVYLASASNERLVARVAEQVGLFDGWFASDATTNLAAKAKAERLVALFGRGNFDYVGNGKADIPVWKSAGRALTAQTPGRIRKLLDREHPDVVHLKDEKVGARSWIRLFRVHQYAKNALVFLPLLASHSFTPEAISTALLAFVAYSVSASGVYILNDLVDLAADRTHRTKKNRPLANGTIPLTQAIATIPVLIGLGLAISAMVSWALLAVLLAYLAVTTAYSFYLKRKLMVDAVTLAALYTVRMVGGAVAIGVSLSQWLLGFAMFLFFSLALMKRYVELAGRLDANLPNPSNRGYRVGDLDVVMALAAGAGLNAVTVLFLYVSSADVGVLYRHPRLLWLICPLLMYWIGRALMLAHRRTMDDDPIVFALRDRISLYVLACATAIIAFAI